LSDNENAFVLRRRRFGLGDLRRVQTEGYFFFAAGIFFATGFFFAAGFFLSAAWVSTEAARLRAGLDLEVLRTLPASFAILGEDFSFLAII